MLPPEYRQYLEQNLSALERFSETFSGLDERIDYVVMQLDTILKGGISVQVQENINRLINTLKEVSPSELPMRTKQIKVCEALQSLTGDKFIRDCPFDATITSIGFHFPPGCDGLVDVAIGHEGEVEVGHSGEQCFPEDGYISLDDATPVFSTNWDVRRGELLWAEIRNADSVNLHTITVIFTLKER